MNDLIEKLSELRSQFNCFNENERGVYHVLSETIKVLSERPEPCEDAVSRKDVETEIANLFKRVFVEYEDIAKKAAAKLPPVTPKTGKWIVHYECPKCGEITKDFTECCPFCNADMRCSQNEPNKQTD